MGPVPVFPLYVFYDGSCSVCAAEMEHYRKKDSRALLFFVDICAPGFEAKPHGFHMKELMHDMHAIDRDGRVYRGVDAFWAIWQALPGRRYRALAAFVALPGVYQAARVCYYFFARIRKYLPKRRRGCSDGMCGLGSRQ